MAYRPLRLLVLAPLFAACVTEPTLRGPLPVRNNHPAQLLVQHLPPTPATALPAGEVAVRLQASYSSLFLTGSGNGNTFQMDGEYLRTALTARIGLFADTEVGCELPFGHTSGGFLDSFLIDYHKALGLPDQDRDVLPKNAFRIAATQDGEQVWSVDGGGFELLDVPLHLSHTLRRPDDAGPGIALRAGIELPTGDERAGYGNGEPDYAVGVLFEQRAYGCAFVAHLQHTFAGTPASMREAGLRFGDVTAVGLGAELPLAQDLAGFLQFEYETSALRNLDLATVSRKQFLVWVGGRYLLAPHCAIEVAFGEDLQGYVSPDFTAWLGLAFL